MSVFIVISGFCLMLPVIRNGGALKGGAPAFFRKRARRILPPYYQALALSLLLIWTLIGRKTGTHWDVSIPVNPGGIIAHLLLVQDIYGSPQINHVFWSIAVECQIYLLFPLLVLLWDRIGGVKTLVGAILASFVALHFLSHTRLSGLTPQYLGLFATGMFGACLATSANTEWRGWSERIPWWIITGIMVVLSGLSIHLGKAYFADYFVGFAAMALLVGATQTDHNPIRSLLSLRPLAGIGLFAYSIYLIHAPLLQVVWQYLLLPLHLGPIQTFALLASFGCPVILAISYLFYLRCERPFISLPIQRIDR